MWLQRLAKPLCGAWTMDRWKRQCEERVPKRDVAQPLITHQYSPAFKVASLCMHVCAHLLLLLVEARSEFERLTGRHLRHHHFLLVGI